MLFRSKGTPPDLDAPSIQVGLRFSTEASPTRADFQVTPTLMTSQHRPSSIEFEGEDFHFGISVGLQNATSPGRLRLASTDPRVQPDLDYNYFSTPYDRERMRDALRTALRIADQPAMASMSVERLSPTDQDFASDESLDSWILCNAYTSITFQAPAKWDRPRTRWPWWTNIAGCMD